MCRGNVLGHLGGKGEVGFLASRNSGEFFQRVRHRLPRQNLSGDLPEMKELELPAFQCVTFHRATLRFEEVETGFRDLGPF